MRRRAIGRQLPQRSAVRGSPNRSRGASERSFARRCTAELYALRDSQSIIEEVFRRRRRFTRRQFEVEVTRNILQKCAVNSVFVERIPNHEHQSEFPESAK